MIVVDTSVWIAHFRDQATPAVSLLRGLPRKGDILVGDVILLECLQGARDDGNAGAIDRALRAFTIVDMLGERAVTRAAEIYRDLRGRGVTVSKTIDLVMGSYCLAHGHVLLHQDRDFSPLTQLGLRTLP